MGRAENGERREPRAASSKRVAAISRACVDFMLRSPTHGIEIIELWIFQAHAVKRERVFGIESWSCAPLAGGPFIGAKQTGFSLRSEAEIGTRDLEFYDFYTVLRARSSYKSVSSSLVFLAQNKHGRKSRK